MVREVLIDSRLLKAFRKRALRKYPNEHCEVLWGRVEGEVAYVYALGAVHVELSNTDEIYASTDEKAGDPVGAGLINLGTIHTHTTVDSWADPSPDDIQDATEENEIVFGVCLLAKLPGYLRVGFNFYNPNGKQIALIVGEPNAHRSKPE